MGEWIGVEQTGILTCARAAGSYWLNVFPEARRAVHACRRRASRIPDPTLRRLALRAHDGKRGNLEGAAAFGAFANARNRPATIRMLVCCQALFDYLDTLSEQESRDPIANGRRLNRALLAALTPDEPLGSIESSSENEPLGSIESSSENEPLGDCNPLEGYYGQRGPTGDGGYLDGLIGICRATLAALPSFATIARPVRLATERIAAYQSLNHGDRDGRRRTFDRWARHEAQAHPDLRWWEAGAASASTLGVFALIAAAAKPDLTSDHAQAIEQAYFPWTNALTTLLDSLADRQEDAASGMPGLIDCYSSPREAAERMGTIATEAMRRARALPDGRCHASLLAAMVSFYLCELPHSGLPHARLVAAAVLDAMGNLAAPMMVILRARLTAERLRAHITVKRAPIGSP